MPYFIAVDLGTTHCKIVVMDEQCKAHQSFKAGVVSHQPQEGWHEQNAQDIYQTVIDLLKQTISVTGANNISCITFSAAMHSLLAVDEYGNALTFAITWADTRSKTYAKELRANETGRKIYTQTGTPIHAMSPLCKLLWIRNERPEIFEQAYKFISIKEYIFFRLFGKYIIDEGIASSSGMYDIYGHCWCKDALSLAGITETKLSQVVASTHEEQLTSQAKAQLRIKNDIPFIAGGNDGSLANLGCGALQPNVAVITTGTSGAVRATIQKPVPGDLHGLFRYILCGDYYATGGGTNNGGVVLNWFAENFVQANASGSVIDDALQLAMLAPAGCDGLVLLPYLLGERAPVYDESAAGVFFGVKMNHSKAHFARAVIEGISFSLVEVLYALEDTYQPVQRIYASGAITQSEWWMQLLANMSGREVVYQDASDASALGAAIMGMYATGFISDLQQAQQFFEGGTIFTPQKGLHDVYKKQYNVFISLYPQLKNLF